MKREKEGTSPSPITLVAILPKRQIKENMKQFSQQEIIESLKNDELYFLITGGLVIENLDNIKDLVITPNLSKYEIHFNIKENINKLEIIVPFSVSPNEIGVNVYDRRKLGIGLSKLTILK